MTATTTTGRELTPQERLGLSRLALVNYMNQGDGPRPNRLNADADNAERNPSQNGIWHTVKRAVRMWWQHHPAQIAIDVARPVLSNYAHEKPLQLLAIAVGAGAAVVLVRPWRLVSMTGLLFATIKSTEFSGLLLSLLSTKSDSPTTPKDMP